MARSHGHLAPFPLVGLAEVAAGYIAAHSAVYLVVRHFARMWL
ncbi:hypothetical protein [Mesorhizobium sp. M7D.F.Ca.US.005.01.1.1]|nr:hypothetical protein [Mesorhizobium sp. M7D.F.Ca.US.005.01.1.1]